MASRNANRPKSATNQDSAKKITEQKKRKKEPSKEDSTTATPVSKRRRTYSGTASSDSKLEFTQVNSFLSTTSSSGHQKKEVDYDDVIANLIKIPQRFSSRDQVQRAINGWKSEGKTFKNIVIELGDILLGDNKELDADLSDDEARQLFPSNPLSRAADLASKPFLNIVNKIAHDNNKVEWLAELHHPVQECFKEFIDGSGSIMADSLGNAVVAQTHVTDQRLKPDRVFGWNLGKDAIKPWVGRIQFPFLVIESKPASKDGERGDAFKMYILEAKAYEHQESCLDIYDIKPEHKMFGIYMVGSKFMFSVYRVIDCVKRPLSFQEIDYKTHPQRILRAIIAIKRWARELREDMITIDEKFEELTPEQLLARRRDNNNNDDDESDRDDTDYQGEHDQGEDDSEHSEGEQDEDDQGDNDQDEQGQDDDAGDEEEDSADRDSASEQDQDTPPPSDPIDLHQSSKTLVIARFDKRRGQYVVDKTTVAEDGVREAELLKGPLKSLSFVPRLIGLAVHENDTATLTMSWHSGQHPQSFTQHKELKIFIKTLLKHVSQLHKRGIIHNDLKEANVLWDSNSLMIIDYGGADQYPSYSTIGTHCYMAPEYPRVPVSDVYSCGVMFFNLLLNFKLSTHEQVSYLRRCNSVQEVEEQILPFLPVSLALWHSAAWDLAKKMTHPISNKRITIKKALNYPYLN